MQETWVRSLGWEDPLEKGKAVHSSILAWRIPWTVQSMGAQRIGHDWVTLTLQPIGPSWPTFHNSCLEVKMKTNLMTGRCGAQRWTCLKWLLLVSLHQVMLQWQASPQLSDIALRAYFSLLVTDQRGLGTLLIRVNSGLQADLGTLCYICLCYFCSGAGSGCGRSVASKVSTQKYCFQPQSTGQSLQPPVTSGGQGRAALLCDPGGWKGQDSCEQL